MAPKRKHRWNRGLPGAFLAAAVFLVASGGLRLYLSYVYSHGLTYGALATPITFLLFYYFIAMAIIIGAQFNNALLEYYPPRISRRARRRRPEPVVRAAAAPIDRQPTGARSPEPGNHRFRPTEPPVRRADRPCTAVIDRILPSALVNVPRRPARVRPPPDAARRRPPPRTP